MKPIKLILYMFFMFLIVGLSCQNQMDGDETSKSLNGTTWKLSGIVNIEKGELKQIDPEGCEDCYTIIFDTDTTFTAVSFEYLSFIPHYESNPSTTRKGTQ